MTQLGVPGANGSPNTIILQGQWAGAIVTDESSWALEDGKLVLDIRKRVAADWTVRCRRAHIHVFTISTLCNRLTGLFISRQILIRSGINDDDSLIDPLSRVVIGVAAEQRNDHALALKCYECSAEEGSWHAMRKLAALFVGPPALAAHS